MMKRFHSVSMGLTMMACIGMVLPSPVLAETAQVGRQALALDVALQAEGYLLGQVVSSQGQVKQGETVLLLHQGEELARVETDAQGRFSIKGLTGGKYDLATKNGVISVRAWKQGTAPPKTALAALLVDGSTVRGQCNCLGGGFHGGHAGVVGTGGTSSYAGGHSNGSPSFNQGGMGYGNASYANSGGCYQQEVVYAPAADYAVGTHVAQPMPAPIAAPAPPVMTGEVHSAPVAETVAAPVEVPASSGHVLSTVPTPCHSHAGVGGPYVADPSATYAGSATGGYSGGCAPGTHRAYNRGVAGGGGGLLGFGMFGGGTVGAAPILAGAAVAAAVAIPVALDDDDDDAS